MHFPDHDIQGYHLTVSDFILFRLSFGFLFIQVSYVVAMRAFLELRINSCGLSVEIYDVNYPGLC